MTVLQHYLTPQGPRGDVMAIDQEAGRDCPLKSWESDRRHSCYDRGYESAGCSALQLARINFTYSI